MHMALLDLNRLGAPTPYGQVRGRHMLLAQSIGPSNRGTPSPHDRFREAAPI